jgi:secreted PhoX family phosphatase
LSISRRRFIRNTAAASASLLVPEAIRPLLARGAAAARTTTAGYGPLVPDPQGLLDLPAGFTYRTLSMAMLGQVDDPRFSQKLGDGSPVPAGHDGMGAFRGPGGITILVRNHELNPGHTPGTSPGDRAYDRLGTGGTSTLWITRDLEVERSFTSLAGTFRNCAGGVTPWGTWLTCEECTYMPGPADIMNHDRRSGVTVPHGYVFEVDSRAEGRVDPVPIRAMGRFYHEAAVVDPQTGFVYLTEDRDDGLFYRYRPSVVTNKLKPPSRLAAGDLARGGVLEALRVVGQPSAMTQNWGAERVVAPGKRLAVDWIEIPKVEPEMDMERDPDDPETDPLRKRGHTAGTSIRAQGFKLGAAQFARGEGAVFHRGAVYFTCTNGGKSRFGQIWKLEPRAQMLSLHAEPENQALLDGPDNIDAAPNGDLVVCEDGREDNFVFGVTPQGRYYKIARNAYNHSELAGACFSPDGTTMFVNIQEPGITFAVRGPWGKRK